MDLRLESSRSSLLTGLALVKLIKLIIRIFLIDGFMDHQIECRLLHLGSSI